MGVFSRRVYSSGVPGDGGHHWRDRWAGVGLGLEFGGEESGDGLLAVVMVGTLETEGALSGCCGMG